MPTMNRSDFVIRSLHYYANLNFESPIFIGDSSNQDEFEKTEAAIKKLGNRLEITHLHLPGLGNYAAVFQLIELVTTTYSVFLPDDDFLVPDSLSLLVRFLEENPDYSCAWGKSLQFMLNDKKGPYGQIDGLTSSNLATCSSLNHESAEERLLAHLHNYTSVFIGACRTAMFKKALESAMELHNLVGSRKDDSWQVVGRFSELIVSYSLVLQGKIKSIDCLHWIRQVHDERYQFLTTFEWITNSHWSSTCEVFINSLAAELKTQDGIDETASRNVIKKVIKIYLIFGLGKKQEGPDEEKLLSFKEKVRKSLKAVPGLKKVYRTTKSQFASVDAMVLEKLLSDSSPYNKDFLPVYELVCMPQKKS